VSDEPYPGWVEVHLDLADGTVAKLFDKPPAFVPDNRLRRDAEYPVILALECHIAGDASTRAPSETLHVILAHGVTDLSGQQHSAFGKRM
jgi:hypothetical protein